MSLHPDITVYAPDRGVLLVAEVTTTQETSPQWAAEFRGELLRHMPIVATAPYFLIVVPNRFFLWRQDHPVAADALPDYAADARPLLDKVVDTARVRLDRMTQDSLEMVVALWLGTLTRTGKNGTGAADRGWIADSGLYDALRGGSVQLSAAA